MAKPKSEIWAIVHDEALQRFNAIEGNLRDERMASLEDRRFYSIAGAQWEGSLYNDWGNRPKIEVNKVHRGVMRIIGEYRNNRISVEYIPKDGSEADDLAETCNGLYRADEEDSCAEEAMDNAFEEAVGGGFGAWRLRTELEDESELLLEVAGTITLEDELEITTEDWLDLDELATELWLDALAK